MSTFDPENFINTGMKGSLDTQPIPVPEGEWTAQVDSVNANVANTQEGEKLVLNLTWNILDPEVSQETKRDRNLVRQSIFLDVKEDGSLDMGTGKNVQLGKVRDALGQNDPKKEWRPSDMQGQQAVVRVRQKPRKDDPEQVDANVVNVRKP